LAMGLDESRIHNCIRVGVGINTTEEEINKFTEELKLHI
jgi:cysteine sulfinate desulfinase/cysteine desulfurase-like protein